MALWFRMYNEALDDPKVQKLPDALFKAWINLLCLAARNGGFLPAVDDISFALRIPQTKAQAIIIALTNAELLDEKDGVVTPHNWNSRQFESDVSTTRVKRFRERQRNAEGNAPETEAEAETETEQNKKEVLPEENVSRETVDYQILFAEWWDAYPQGRKQARPKCYEKYCQIVKAKKATPYELLRGAQRYRAAGYADDPYVAMPLTWLNQGRWTDENIRPAGDRTNARIIAPQHRNGFAAHLADLESEDRDFDGQLRGTVLDDAGGNGVPSGPGEGSGPVIDGDVETIAAE